MFVSLSYYNNVNQSLKKNNNSECKIAEDYKIVAIFEYSANLRERKDYDICIE